MLGLFQQYLPPQRVSSHPLHNVESFTTATNLVFNAPSFLLTSVFVIYFALYRAKSFRINCLMLVLRVLTLMCYIPTLLYFGSYIDAGVIWVVVVSRLAYTIYWAVKYRSFSFVLLNSDKLAFICGKYWYYEDKPYIVLMGGEHFINFGPHFVTFVLPSDVYVALRGYIENDVPLVRRVELINGAFIYVFAQEACVGVYNICCDVQLCEEDNENV
uniref:ORF3 protein n=1 Tax=Bat Coronavirus RaYN20 TaxID=3018887 RepID=A0AA49ECA3_9NIDO|nr:ORF3 protein [Bat Coronavirus RaYN20]